MRFMVVRVASRCWVRFPDIHIPPTKSRVFPSFDTEITDDGDEGRATLCNFRSPPENLVEWRKCWALRSTSLCKPCTWVKPLHGVPRKGVVVDTFNPRPVR